MCAVGCTPSTYEVQLQREQVHSHDSVVAMAAVLLLDGAVVVADDVRVQVQFHIQSVN